MAGSSRSVGARSLPGSMAVAMVVNDPVMGLIAERRCAGSRPGERADGARIALAIEGGGMAGSVSAGMCAALESLGMVDSFDVIYGSSAGAMNASYLAAGQARERTQLYGAAARQRLIDPRRALRGRPPFVLDQISGKLFEGYPHDAQVLVRTPPFRVTAARVADKALAVLGDFTSLDEVRLATRASAAVPVLAGGTVEFRGECYVDGGLIESMPYATALREGATHVLVLRSHPRGYRKPAYESARRLLVDRLLRGASDTVIELVHERPARYNAQAAALEHRDVSGLDGRVTQLSPSVDAPLVSQLESRPQRLEAAIAMGAGVVHHAFRRLRRSPANALAA